MSTPTLAPPTGDFDDFRAWETELDASHRDQFNAPKVPAHPTRAALQREADAEIEEGYATWLRASKHEEA